MHTGDIAGYMYSYYVFTKCDGVSVCVVVGLGVGSGSGGNVSSVQVALDISQPQLTWEVDGWGYHEDVII